MSLTFVVGTGRCGSTALSEILHQHPEVLSLSELFSMLKGSLRRKEIPSHDMDGPELWRMLTIPDGFADARIRDGLTTVEMGYPYGRGRFDPATGIPRICHNMLAMLSDDPDALFDLMEAEILTWPARPAGDQYREVFGFLARSLGRRAVVERSGASLTIVQALHEQFPEARFVHMYRDGLDCALSMSRHPVFRLAGFINEAGRAAGLLGLGSWEKIEAEVQRLHEAGALDQDYTGLLMWPFDAKRYMSYKLPVTFFGELWSSLICEGVAELSQLPPGTWTGLRYEDLLREPDQELGRLAGFIGTEAPRDWLDNARSRLGTPRSTAASQLADSERTALRAACEPGIRALAEAELAQPPTWAGSRA